MNSKRLEITRSVLGLSWALFSLRICGKHATTYAGIRKLTGVETNDATRALVARAREEGMVRRWLVHSERTGKKHPVVGLTNHGARVLERLMSNDG